MGDSILDSTKKILGFVADNTAFDVDVIMHINTVFSDLEQLGIGPAEGFAIEDATPTWEDYLGTDLRLNNIKSYTYLRVRMLVDPPATSYLLNAMKDQIRELEWRINVRREDTSWVDPTPATIVEPEVIIVPSNQAWYSE